MIEIIYIVNLVAIIFMLAIIIDEIKRENKIKKYLNDMIKELEDMKNIINK